MRRRFAALLVALALLTVGCTSPGASSGGRGSVQTPASSDPAAPASTRPAEPVSLAVLPAQHARRVDPGTSVRVVATGAILSSVEIRSGATQLAGQYDAQRHRWHSTEHLRVATRYTVRAVATDASGQTHAITSWFDTLAPRQTFTAQIAEQPGATYGVGMPIQISFDRPIVDRAAIERALQVTTSTPVIGAWYWLDSEHLNFRPRDYWPAHIRVSVAAHFNGVHAAPGVFGSADLRRSFEIGTSLIAVVSTLTHRLQLYRDGRLVHNWPISSGRPGDDTPNGTYLTIEKANPVEMRPADLAPGQPGYYDLWVPWSVRFTWTGDYLHDAWWSVDQQGHVNVSHGCVNLPPAAAEEYYKLAVPGDPVTITGSPVAGDQGNGWTDWFVSWRQLLRQSALHQAVAAGPQGSTYVAAGSLPASSARPPTGRPADGNAAATGG